MSLERLDNGFLKELGETLSAIHSLRSRYESALKEQDAIKEALNQRVLEVENSKRLASKIEGEARDNESKAIQVLREASEKQSALESSELRLKEIESNLAKRQASINETQSALSDREQDLVKRERLIGMEERRLKLFEHKLNLVAQDEKIKKALKEIA